MLTYQYKVSILKREKCDNIQKKKKKRSYKLKRIYITIMKCKITIKRYTNIRKMFRQKIKNFSAHFIRLFILINQITEETFYIFRIAWLFLLILYYV